MYNCLSILHTMERLRLPRFHLSRTISDRARTEIFSFFVLLTMDIHRNDRCTNRRDRWFFRVAFPFASSLLSLRKELQCSVSR